MTTVSIIICTQNRADFLKPTLESIGRATVPVGWTVEMHVIDNKSTDSTRKVVSEANLKNIAVHYEYESTPGKCYACNTGLNKSKGEVILFTDDDIRVPTNWIAGMCTPILEGKADAIAGGIVFPPHIAYALYK